MEIEDLEDPSVDASIKETDEKIAELSQNKERSAEEEAELKRLKSEKRNLVQERIDELTKARREAERALERERQEKEELRRKYEEKEIERPAVKSINEQITINGKKFYTDRALQSMVASGDMSQDEAWQHQQERIEEKAVERLKNERNKETEESVRQQTIKEVLEEYPHFNPQHPNHNPNDPLYREASRILNNGYLANPRGIKLAIEDAKRILRLDSKRPDLSEELSVTTNGSSSLENRREKKAELTEFEQEQAIRLYVYGGRTNPATGKVYTRKEAIERALKAKQDRSSQSTTRR